MSLPKPWIRPSLPRSRLARLQFDAVRAERPVSPRRQPNKAAAADLQPKSRLHGQVGLQLTVTEAGKVEDVKVIKSLDPELDANAVKTVRTWKFRPATKNGQPAPVHIRVMLSFELYRQP